MCFELILFISSNGDFDHTDIIRPIYKDVYSKCTLYKEQLTFSCFGFGKNEIEFEITKNIVECTKMAESKVTFTYTYHDDGALATALGSSAASLTETRSILSRQDGDKGKMREKNYKIKNAYEAGEMIDSEGWLLINNTAKVETKSFFQWMFSITGKSTSFCERLELAWTENKDKTGFDSSWKRCDNLHPEAVGIAVSKKYFGEGSERIVYEMLEVDRTGNFVGIPLVAKESLYMQKKQDLESLCAWHKIFLNSNESSKICGQVQQSTRQ